MGDQLFTSLLLSGWHSPLASFNTLAEAVSDLMPPASVEESAAVGVALVSGKAFEVAAMCGVAVFATGGGTGGLMAGAGSAWFAIASALASLLFPSS